jgi:hypothetical protein
MIQVLITYNKKKQEVFQVKTQVRRSTLDQITIITEPILREKRFDQNNLLLPMKYFKKREHDESSKIYCQLKHY